MVTDATIYALVNFLMKRIIHLEVRQHAMMLVLQNNFPQVAERVEVVNQKILESEPIQEALSDMDETENLDILELLKNYEGLCSSSIRLLHGAVLPYTEIARYNTRALPASDED